MAHSLFSASSAHRWIPCAGSVVLSEGIQSRTSIHAAEGTAAHAILERCLVQGLDAPDPTWAGEVIDVEKFTIVVDAEMLEHVGTALANIREMTADADILQAETQVNYAQRLDVSEPDAWGTADVIALCGTELQVHDYKHGRGVEVSAENNPQLMLYAAGALREFSGFASIDRVRMVIHQPRITRAPSEWSISVGELHTWLAEVARPAAGRVITARTAAPGHTGFLNPGEKQCRWCPAKATCPALRDEVVASVFDSTPSSAEDFDDLTALTSPPADTGIPHEHWLASCLAKVDMIEDWCKAIRAEAERRLLAGESVPGYKLVPGKRGARAWSDPTAAEDLLRKQFRLPIEKAYDLKLISPTAAEKLVKAGDIGERQWAKAQKLITQTDGKPHVAPVTDPRPAIEIKPVSDMFEAQASDVDLANLV